MVKKYIYLVKLFADKINPFCYQCRRIDSALVNDFSNIERYKWDFVFENKVSKDIGFGKLLREFIMNDFKSFVVQPYIPKYDKNRFEHAVVWRDTERVFLIETGFFLERKHIIMLLCC